MQNPTGVQTAQANFSTAAAANTVGATTLIASPGAGNRLRIWWVAVAFALSTAGASALAAGRFRESTGARAVPWAIAEDGAPAWHMEFPGGLPIAEATAYETTHVASAASQNLWLIVGYTVERVT